MSDVHDMSYYQKCMVGGILSCGITHTIVCPLDIVKCRMQVSFPLQLLLDKF
jgi:solute carrier family 25 phosphate transporter 3